MMASGDRSSPALQNNSNGFKRFLAAVGDGVRAWNISPHLFEISIYDPNTKQLISRRPYHWYERIMIKVLQAATTFWRSLRLREATEVRIPCLGTEGLLANFLHVLEVAHRVRPGARLHVDWTLKGSEIGFRYGKVGENVWPGLFHPVGSRNGDAFHADSPLDFAFWGSGKDYLTGRSLDLHREAYGQTYAKWVEVTNARVCAEVEAVQARMRGRFCVGVHRRVGNTMVANFQRDGAVPTLQKLLDRIHAEVRAANAADWMVFLATDDSQVVPIFLEALGDRLIVRNEVQRTTEQGTEVHFGEWGKVSGSDAEDVLIDTLLLAKCNVLIHAASSISTAASLINPKLVLARVSGAL
ncbi:MAG TPA: nodulation protein NodZ [Candidatus Angelobacter sp.]|nr:nodulation protein NodZ [Candidatus Angelobacter sp.]